MLRSSSAGQTTSSNGFRNWPTDLVRRQVSVIVGNQSVRSMAARRRHHNHSDRVRQRQRIRSRAVSSASLNRPEGNLTGVTFFGGAQLDAKRLELLRDLVPEGHGRRRARLNPNYHGFRDGVARRWWQPPVRSGGRSWSCEPRASANWTPAFATFLQSGAKAHPAQRQSILHQPAPHASSHWRRATPFPAIYDLREFVHRRRADELFGEHSPAPIARPGVYAGKILKGAKPSDLPVARSPPSSSSRSTSRPPRRSASKYHPHPMRADEVIECRGSDVHRG